MESGYQNSKIYKLLSPSRPELIYIGSTVQPLSERLRLHKKDYKRHLDGKVGKWSAFQLIEIGDSYIELIELFPCTTKEELTAREAHFIRTMDCCNKVIPDRTQKEYREDHKSEKREYNKKYWEENKSVVGEKNRQYQKDNKDAISKWRCEKVSCECGSNVSRSNIAIHKKSKKHIKFVANN